MDFADIWKQAAFRAEIHRRLDRNLPDKTKAPLAIAGSTSEIQQNTIGESVLGLPKG